MRTRSTLLIVPALLALAACDEGGTGVTAGGEYRAVLQSPNGAEGAAAFELEGSGVQSVAGGEDTRVFMQPAAGGTRVVVVREPAGPIEFTLTLAPGSRMPRARVVEVADGQDQPRASLAGYRVALER
ncbi:MAG TPA: hypothetical protein VF142_19950 [Longimicrobium sp.]